MTEREKGKSLKVGKIRLKKREKVGKGQGERLSRVEGEKKKSFDFIFFRKKKKRIGCHC